MTKEISLLINVKDEATKSLKGLNKTLNDLQPSFAKIFKAGAIGFTALSGAIGFSVKEAIEAQTAQNRLTQLLRVTNDATDEQISVLLEQAEALEKVGVMSKDNIVTAQSQLATFDLQIDSIKTLTPAIMDYVVAEKGMFASTEDVRSLTNGLAQALNGNFKSLTNIGFVLDDVTKEYITNGTEVERAQALASVLDSTYKDFNKTATETAQGSLILLNRSLGDIKEAIGTALLPYLKELVDRIKPVMEEFKKWAEDNPKLIATLVGIGGALSGIAVAIGLVGMAMPKMIEGVQLLEKIFTTKLGLVVLAILIVIGIIALLIKYWDKIMEHPVVQVIWNTIKTSIENLVLVFQQNLMPALEILWEHFQKLLPFLELLAKVYGIILLGALLAVVKIIEFSLIIVIGILTKSIELGTKAIEFFKAMWDGVITVLSKVVEWVDKVISSIKRLDVVKKSVSAVSNFVSDVFGGGKAVGGYVSSKKTYLVGEQGPELFSPSTNGSIIPNNKLGSNGGINITITRNTIMSSDDITDLVNRGIVNALRLNNQLSY